MSFYRHHHFKTTEHSLDYSLYIEAKQAEGIVTNKLFTTFYNL